MKATFALVSALSLFVAPLFAEEGAVVANEKTYLLAKKGYVPPVGTVTEESQRMTLKEGGLDLNFQGQIIEGQMSINEMKTIKHEVLAPDQIRYTLTQSATKQRMVMMGQPAPIPERINPLLNKPVLLTKKDDAWTGALEKGEAREEEKVAIDKVVQRLNQDVGFKTYGGVPRKIGDQWEVESGDILGLEEMEGNVTVKFVKVEKFQGVTCAVLDCSMDLTGTQQGLEDVSMKLLGDYTIYRSLKDLIDLNGEIKGTMTMEGELAPQPGFEMEMKMKGAMTMTIGHQIIRPPR